MSAIVLVGDFDLVVSADTPDATVTRTPQIAGTVRKGPVVSGTVEPRQTVTGTVEQR